MELLRQVRVIDPVAQSDRVLDVLLENGKIQAIVAKPCWELAVSEERLC